MCRIMIEDAGRTIPLCILPEKSSSPLLKVVPFMMVVVAFSRLASGQLITEITWEIPPDRVAQPFYFPAPVHNDYQRPVVRIENGSYTVVANSHGSQILKVLPHRSPLRINFTVYSEWKDFATSLRDVPAQITNVPSAIARYLWKTPLADPGNSQIAQLATRLEGITVLQSLTHGLRHFETNIPVT